MGGKGAEYLAYSFDRMLEQTFKDFDVVISDQSKDEEVKKMCDAYRGKLDITYSREPTGRRDQCSNFNNGLKYCTGKLIKIMWLDDFFYHKDALKEIVNTFDLSKDHWLAAACTHTEDCKTFFRPHQPTYDDKTIFHKNGLGAPSVITIKNDNPLKFDENMKVWFTDIDYYKRYFDAYGMPKIISNINVVIRIHPNSVSNSSVTEKKKVIEWNYIVKKFNLPHPRWQMFTHWAGSMVRRTKIAAKAILGRKS